MSDKNLFWNRAAVVLPLGGKRLRLFQPVTRRNLVAPIEFIDVVDLLQAGCPEKDFRTAVENLTSDPVLQDATSFTLWDHVFRNPDMFDVGEIEDTASDFEDVLDLMTSTGFVADTADPPLDFEKRSFGDRFRGTYHEQIGTESLFNRTEPAEWWTRQKFEADLKTLRETPYRDIEQRFLKSYLPGNVADMDVLEVGCGTGFFTGLIDKHAKTAVGMDYNANYIETARRDNPQCEFHVGDLLALDRFDAELEGRRFDRIVLIDTFLFLFDRTFQNDLYERRIEIMRNLCGFLNPSGRMLILDPHPFWLTPWIGGGETPVGLISEYRDRWFKVTPTLEEVSEVLAGAGMNITRVLEPDIDPGYADVDPIACRFMSQFPQWWFFEAVAAAE